MIRRGLLIAAVFAFGLALPANAPAFETWIAETVEKRELPQDFPAEIVVQPLQAAPSGIDNMLEATASSGDIRRAWYSQPTTRYGHGILGDKNEGGVLVVELENGRKFTARLSEVEVFEDLYPRIVDLDGDGRNEVVTIRSSLIKGAAITAYGIVSDGLVRKASTGFIGKRNRWLNIAGIDTYLAGGPKLIAFVSTPHIGGTLGFLVMEKGRLRLLASEDGYSNHVIGSTELRLSASVDLDGDGAPELAVPTADRKQLRIVSLKRSGISLFARASLPSPLNKAIGIETADGQTRFITGLENGDVVRIRRQ